MKKLMAYINAEGITCETMEELAIGYENAGIDEILIYNHTEQEEEREEFLYAVREVLRNVDIPVMVGCKVNRFEDVKKAFYTGAYAVLLQYTDIKGKSLLKEAVDRFGKKHIYIETDISEAGNDGLAEELLSGTGESYGNILFKHTEKGKLLTAAINSCKGDVIIRDSLIRNDLIDLFSYDSVSTVCTNHYEKYLLSSENRDNAGNVIMKVKRQMRNEGYDMNTFEGSLSFADLKKNSDGLIPCVVQDYKTDEVLMLAYMNKEAYDNTVETGRMTYYSRSRSELWVKGMTSGHFQYVKKLTADCDKDTLLAKVMQVGAACHTGNRSCFFNDILKHEFEEKNAYRVLSSLYDVVKDRKSNPKEGSYTNYLFDKGIDKILKKCGEEAAEMIIAAKNPNKEEVRYEIADLLYHMTVLMVECGVDWEDCISELANR